MANIRASCDTPATGHLPSNTSRLLRSVAHYHVTRYTTEGDGDCQCRASTRKNLPAAIRCFSWESSRRLPSLDTNNR